MSAEDSVTLDIRGYIAILTLNRPDVYNSVTQAERIRLAEVLSDVDKRPEVKITLLTGAGKFFSSGANVRHREPAIPGDSLRIEAIKRLTSSNMSLARLLYRHSKILVAALNGPAIGIAAALLGNFDFIYAVQSAYLLTPFAALGIVPETASSVTFAQRMGTTKAKEALVMGRRMQADELLACGFVNKVFPNQEQPAFTDTVVAHLRAEFDPLDLDAAIVSRNLIRDADSGTLEAANIREVMTAVDAFEMGKPQEAFAEFAAKRRKHKL